VITLVIRIREVPYAAGGGPSSARSTDLPLLLLRDKVDPPPTRGSGDRPGGSWVTGSMPAYHPPLPGGASTPLRNELATPGTPLSLPGDGGGEGHLLRFRGFGLCCRLRPPDSTRG
jgi:hypothetical protein